MPTLPSFELPRQISKKKQIYDMMLARIQDQSLPEGTRLPSTAVLAEQWCVAHVTAHAALTELTRDGWLVRYPKHGTFVSNPSKSRAGQLCKTAVVLLPPRDEIVASGNGGEVFEMLQGLADGARSIDWQIRIESAPNPSRERSDDRIKETILNHAAAIFIGASQFRTLIGQLSEIQFPTVTLGGNPGEGNAVIYDRPAAVRMGIGYLFEKGYRRIGYFGNTQDVKYEAYRETMRERGLDFDSGRSGHCASRLHAREAIREFLRNPRDCDALFVSNYKTAASLAQEAARHGIRIPDDLAIVALGVAEHPSDHLALSYVRVPYLEFGIEGIKLLGALPHSPSRKPQIKTLQPELIPGESA